jgi:hypothetical protein
MPGVSLAERLAAAISDDSDRTLARSILGTDEPEHIEGLLTAFAERELGSAITELAFFELSVAAVFGLDLRDGRRVVVKAFGPDMDPAFVDSLITVQRYLARDFPCPTVLGPKRSFGANAAVVMPMLDEGSYVDATAAPVRAEWAALLNRQIEDCRPLTDLPGIVTWRPPAGRLWHRPHNALFEFEHTHKGAEWIDAIAADALVILEGQTAPLLLGHADWSAKHFRLSARRPSGRRITAVYDWDSLRYGTEAEIVAGAAVTFSVTWYVPGRDALPSVEDSLAFVADYETARPGPFSAAERLALVAAARYARAYTARCEHSLDPNERNVHEGSARAMLRDVVNDFRL